MNTSRTGVTTSCVITLALLACLAPVPAHAQVRARTPSTRRTPSASRPIRGTLHIVADLTARKLHLLAGTRTVRTYTIAIGDPTHPTPTGQFHIRRIVWNPKWIPPEEAWAADKAPQPPGARANPMRLVKIFFQEPNYYIHGSNEPRSVGYALSHGCIRMEPMDAFHLAQLLMDRNGARHSAAWYARVLRTRGITQTVRLPRPVALEVVR